MKINELTKFSITLFLIPWLPAFLLYKHSLYKYALVVIIVFLSLSVLCFFCKNFAKWLKSILSKIGNVIGKYIAIFALTIVYIAAVIPTGLIMKLVKRDRLKLKKQKSDSYWINQNTEKTDYEYQF